MSNMNEGVEAFRAKLESLGAKNIGIYVGVYFMEEHSIDTDKFTSVWFLPMVQILDFSKASLIRT